MSREMARLDLLINLDEDQGKAVRICLEMDSVLVSDPDPDPCGSVLKRLPWIRIRIGNTDLDPYPGQSKWCPIRKKNLRLQA